MNCVSSIGNYSDVVVKSSPSLECKDLLVCGVVFHWLVFLFKSVGVEHVQYKGNCQLIYKTHIIYVWN